MDIIAGASLARRRVNLPFSIVKTRTRYRVCCCRIRGSLEISRSVRSGEKTKIAEVNLLGLTGDLDCTLMPRVVKTIETLLAQDLASGRPVNTGGGSSGQQYRTYHALGQLSAKGIMLEPLRPASRGSADQRRFADRGIRIVTLALGGDLGTDLGCTAIIMPSAHFYSCPSNDRGASSSDTSRQCYSTPPSSVHQERTP